MQSVARLHERSLALKWSGRSGPPVLRSANRTHRLQSIQGTRGFNQNNPPTSHISIRQRVVPRATDGHASGLPLRLKSVITTIDELNSKDPRTIEVNGQSLPYELAYSQWLTDWVKKLTEDGNPEPSEELLIVARGQHVQRWVLPRKSYPEGRTAYLKWREDLKKMHAKTVIKIMDEMGYSGESCSKVESMMLKRDIKEQESQIIEDALCLVFLEFQFSEFRLKESEEKMVGIIKKTWGKMGAKGRAAALALAPNLGIEEQGLVGKALSS